MNALFQGPKLARPAPSLAPLKYAIKDDLMVIVQGEGTLKYNHVHMREQSVKMVVLLGGRVTRVTFLGRKKRRLSLQTL